ncbi:hypothetical protein LJC63_05790 [Ruminococcaceae bacterium OttesenSCG-928-L11]|nr:hypothetical protein [Ruminococcaceae bacterium OttesenSCG-928-L11]
MKTPLKAKWIALILVAMLSLTSCSQVMDIVNELNSASGSEASGPEASAPAADDEASATRTSEDLVYYNGYTGLKITVPKGYYITYLNDVNLTRTEGESSSYLTLDWYDYGTGEMEMSLAGVQSQSSDSSMNHSEIDMFVVEHEDYSDTADFFEYYTEWMLRDGTDGFHSTMDETGTEVIKGRTFHKLIATVTHADNNSDFTEEYYVTAVGGEAENTYLIVYLNYWNNSKVSESSARFMLENCFDFGSGTAI